MDYIRLWCSGLFYSIKKIFLKYFQREVKDFRGEISTKINHKLCISRGVPAIITVSPLDCPSIHWGKQKRQLRRKIQHLMQIFWKQGYLALAVRVLPWRKNSAARRILLRDPEALSPLHQASGFTRKDKGRASHISTESIQKTNKPASRLYDSVSGVQGRTSRWYTRKTKWLICSKKKIILYTCRLKQYVHF